MKRSRAPSTIASTTTRQQHSATSGSRQEESQQSLEVDVGMEDLCSVSDSTPVGNAGSGQSEPVGRRRSSFRASGGSGGRRGARGSLSNGGDRDATGAAKEATNGSTSKSRRGKGGGVGRDSKVKEEAVVPAPAGGDEKENYKEEAAVARGEGVGPGAAGSRGVDVSAGGGANPPPKKKKKYIRNPETHKEYRTRMEAELAQARKMLEEGNAAMVDLARDYKRQQALIEQYRAQDNSLISISQLSQSQPTAQQQMQQQQQQGGEAGTGMDGFLGCAHDSVDKEKNEVTSPLPLQDPEMNSQQLSQEMPLSQTSAITLSLPEAEESLSQATQWLAAFQDSQEAWSLDDILMFSQDLGAEEEGEGSNKAEAAVTAVGDEEGDRGLDSVEAVVLALGALSPSRLEASPARPFDSLPMSPAPRSPPLPLIPVGGGGAKQFPGKRLPGDRIMTEVVRVGLACMVTNPRKPGCVLVGKRKGSIGAGTLGLPGGHLEIGEEWPACAMREVLEETGLDIETPTFSWVTNCAKMEGGKHYVTIFMLAAVSDPDEEPRLIEPDRCAGWSWEPWKSLGSRKSSRARVGVEAGSRFPGVPLFEPLAALRSTTYNPFRGII